MREYYVCYICWNGQRLVSVEKVNSAEEAEKKWRSHGAIDPRTKLVTITTDRAVMENFRYGRL